MSTEPSTPPTGAGEAPSRLGPVVLRHCRGRGAMGEVWEGLDEELGRPVAVKLLAAVEDEESRARFEREAQALARLNHPNVVAVHSKGYSHGRPYFVMELVDGPTVEQVVRSQGPMAVAEALEVIRQAALGLMAAAEAGVIHRDVKPANLLMAPDGTVKVADFGVCKLADGAAGLTQDGSTVGTPYYMAPEQARGGTVDARADQYALGATLYHLLTGTPPYGVTDTMAQLLAHQQRPVPDIRSVAPAVPRAVALLIRRMMAKNPRERFAGYPEVLEAVDNAQLGVAPPLPGRPWTLMALALMGTALAGASFLLPQSETDAPTPAVIRIVRHVPVAAPGAVGSGGVAAAAPAVDAPAAPEDRVELLLRAAARESGQGRAAALTALSRTSDPRARAALQKILLTADDEDAPLCALLLGEMGDQAATDALVLSLESPRRATVLAAVDALTLLRDVRAVAPLKDLARRHPDATVRHRAKKAGTLLFGVEGDP